MNPFQSLLFVILKFIMWVILSPFKIVDYIVRWYIVLSTYNTNEFKEFMDLKRQGIEVHNSEKKLFESIFDNPKSKYWRGFSRHKYHKFIFSIMVWIILIIRYTIL